MSDSEDSTVTYTQVSSPFADLSYIGSPGVDGPPMMPEDPYAYIVAAYQAPSSLDYIPGPEDPQSPPLLDFVPEPMYPEYMPIEDEILPAEEQPLPATASPTADSPGYVPESDPEEDPDEDNENPEEDPTEYPASHIHPLGYRAAMIRLRAEVASTSHSPLLPPPIILSYTRPAAPSSGTPPLHLLSTDRREDRPGVCPHSPPPPPVNHLGRGYVLPRVLGMSWREVQSAAATKTDWSCDRACVAVTGVGHAGNLACIGNTQDRQTQIYQRVETLGDDSQYHYETARLLDQEALVSREAWDAP
ncbi:hypothetical protein Tco_0705474 [Tanacetum coccineum]|uniref:Uncharacterized protein n=1 Tax=Tanacetum coccineum TaxID=301880 RepID=A0ABQ4Y6P3_9ASTR